MEPQFAPKPFAGAIGFYPRLYPVAVTQGLTDVISVNPPKIKDIEYNVQRLALSRPAPDQTMTKIMLKPRKLINEQYWLGHDHSHTAIHAACAFTACIISKL